MRICKILIFILAFSGKIWSQYSLPANKDSLNLGVIVEQNHYIKPNLSPYQVKALPFFCKIEADIFKKSNVNFAFRLGSLDHVNKLESKTTPY